MIVGQVHIEQYVRYELIELKERIARNIISTNRNASGDTIRSMNIQITSQGGGSFVTAYLYGRPYFSALETGSRPWRNQYKRVPQFFADIIQEWIDAKGLDLNAYAVATKIMRQGSKLYRDGGRNDVYTQEIPLTLERLASRLGDIYAKTTLANINL